MVVIIRYKLRSRFGLVFLFGVVGSVMLLLLVSVIGQSVFAGQRQEYEMLNMTAGQVGVLDDLDGPQRYGLGVFRDSSEINLGNDLEFRSGLEIAHQFSNKMRAGIAIYHLSNGGLSSQNPGTEALVFSLCIPIKKTG